MDYDSWYVFLPRPRDDCVEKDLENAGEFGL
jgi:hypothetical protein